MFDHILEMKRKIAWTYGEVTCAEYPLTDLDTVCRKVKQKLKSFELYTLKDVDYCSILFIYIILHIFKLIYFIDQSFGWKYKHKFCTGHNFIRRNYNTSRYVGWSDVPVVAWQVKSLCKSTFLQKNVDLYCLSSSIYCCHLSPTDSSKLALLQITIIFIL